jgi:hypothetical protein
MANPFARWAMINGIISIVLATIVLLSNVGFAGIITGSYAIIRGIRGLNYAKQFDGQPGRGQAITGIVLGVCAILMVILSFVLRG